MIKIILSLFLLTVVIYSADLSRDSQGIVTDISTKLQWQDNISSVKKKWSEAIIYCENISLGGHYDWRLPNRNELISIIDYSKYRPAIKESVFQNNAFGNHWSSSSYANNSVYASWYVDFYNGYTDYKYSNYIYYVRCVRGR